ncbi:MAG TPA: DUF3645 domain-containing protein, partial [Parachlamydiaceae bacterium]|nr:DUF3645 domain-containing protein [Parachlamydiaceae bacterium]
MTTAVVNREYITVTNETLRAMRCKYIKMRLIINEKLIASNGKETVEILQLESCNDILKEMLMVMKERGVFTFDEVHQAFDPKKELNMPFGNITPINFAQASLMGRIITFAAHARSSNEALLQLHENRQSQQTEEQYASMLKIVADKLINDPKIKNDLDLSDNEIEKKQLLDYLLGLEENLPPFIEKKEREKAELIVLAKQMLAGKWLKERLGKSIDEHHGFSHGHKGPRIAIPFVANNSPSEGSEFSDANVMMINTFMTYISQGLSYEQLQELVDDLKNRAYIERLEKKEEDPGFSLQDTEEARQFLKVCGLDLFMINKDNQATLEKINRALIAENDEAALLLFDYVVTHVFPKVEIYDHQVCSHGRNTASMAQSFLGYSGSLDNQNLAPPDTTLLPEKGTNGQTVDLFIRQNNEWWVVDSASSKGTCSLIADLYEKHPERAQIGAMIDVGSYFRGIPNRKVAEMICQSLERQNSPRAGVLFFDPVSGSLYFMNKHQTGHPLKLSGTRPEIIQKETGYNPDLLFVYYDQEHITGTDIQLGKKTKAIITWSEHTKIHDALQGGRRLRELDLQQRLISAVEKGALSKIGSKLQKPSLAELVIGKVDPKKNSIQDLVLFSHLNEYEELREENILFCLQDMANTLQQCALNIAYK